MSKVIIDTIREVIRRADECKLNQNNDFERGRLLAFTEVLGIMKSDFIGDEEIETELDFDIDARYYGMKPAE